MSRLTLPMIALLAAICFGAPSAADGPQVAPPPRETLTAQELVKRLSSDEFQEREEATRRLAALDVASLPPELLAAMKSADPDLRERASKAVEAIRWRVAGRQLECARKLADRGAIDLFVASSAAWDVKA